MLASMHLQLCTHAACIALPAGPAATSECCAERILPTHGYQLCTMPSASCSTFLMIRYPCLLSRCCRPHTSSFVASLKRHGASLPAFLCCLTRGRAGSLGCALPCLGLAARRCVMLLPLDSRDCAMAEHVHSRRRRRSTTAGAAAAAVQVFAEEALFPVAINQTQACPHRDCLICGHCLARCALDVASLLNARHSLDTDHNRACVR